MMSTQKRQYGPYVASGLLHAAILVFIVWGVSEPEPPKKVYRPQYIEAKLLDLKPKTKKPMAAQKAPEKKPDPVKPAPPPPSKVIVKKQPDAQEVAKEQKEAEQKRAAEQQKKAAEQQAKAAADKKAKELAAAKAKQEQAKLKAAEAAKQEAAAKAKKAAEEKAKKAAEEKAKKAAADKAKAEAARKKEQEIQRHKEQSMAQALAEEESLLMAEQSDVVAQSYIAAIADRIERNWSRPPSARNGMVCVLRIALVPTGQVVDVSIVKSSGNGAFDRSAMQAVQKVERFDELKNMPSDVFEANFRVLILNFSPEDLRL